MVLIAMLKLPDERRGRRGIWFTDDTAALTAPVRGRSTSENLVGWRATSTTPRLPCNLDVLEWVESKSNWADGISGEELEDEWHQRHGFRVGPSGNLGNQWRCHNSVSSARR